MSEISENKNNVVTEEYTTPSEVEKAFKKSKTKLIIKGICLALAALGNLILFLGIAGIVNPQKGFLSSVCLIIIVAGYVCAILSNAVVGLFKQYFKIIGKCGSIVPFIGWIFGALFGLIAMIFLPTLFSIAPLKNELEKYNELKLML